MGLDSDLDLAMASKPPCFDFGTQIRASWGLVLTSRIILICTSPSLLGLVHKLELARA